jgi:major type 1 subunit fimbrin (pilin)
MLIHLPGKSFNQAFSGLGPIRISLKRAPQIILLAISVVSPITATANQGLIAFDGNVTSPTCTVAGTGAASGSGSGITLNFGDIRITDLQSADTWSAAVGKAFNLVVTCPGNMSGYRTARATLTPAAGSGVDPNDGRLLRLTSGSVAKGVAVGLWSSTTSGPLNLSSNPDLIGPFVVTGANGIATISVNAIYSRTAATPVAGTALATLPFSLTYE